MGFLTSFRDTFRPMSGWSFCIIATLILMPPVGSWGSIIIFFMSVVAWKVWLFDKPIIGLTRTEKWVMAIVGYYFLSAMFCAAIKAETFSDTYLVWNNLGLVVGLSLLPILRVKADETWLDKIVIAVALAGIFVASVTLFFMYRHMYNFELFSGNSLILAYLVGLNAVLGLVFFLNHQRFSWLSLVGTIGSIFALVMTGRRGPLLAMLIVFLPILILAARQNFGKILIFLLGISIAGGVLNVTNGPSVFNALRLSQTLATISDPLNPIVSEQSIFARLSMYQDGFEAFKRAPLLGYGRQNITKAAAVHGLRATPEFKRYNYSHLHNALITEAVASGIFGIVGLIGMYIVPVFVSWRGPPIIRLMGVSYSAYFVLYSATNIGFYHDVTVFSFLFIVALLNALATSQWES